MIQSGKVEFGQRSMLTVHQQPALAAQRGGIDRSPWLARSRLDLAVRLCRRARFQTLHVSLAWTARGASVGKIIRPLLRDLWCRSQSHQNHLRELQMSQPRYSRLRGDTETTRPHRAHPHGTGWVEIWRQYPGQVARYLRPGDKCPTMSRRSGATADRGHFLRANRRGERFDLPACTTDACSVARVSKRRTSSVAPARIISSGDLGASSDRLCNHAGSMPAVARALSTSSMVDTVRACSAESRKRGLRPVVGSFPS